MNQAVPVTDAASQVQKLLRQQAAIARFGSFALRERNLTKILTEAARVCAEGLGARFCKVCQYRPEMDDLLIVAGHGWRDGVIGHVVSRANMHSPQGRAFVTGEPLIIDDLKTEAGFDPPPFYAAHGIVSTVDVIIKGSDEQPFGILEVDSDKQHDYDEYDTNFLTGFANVLAEAVATANRVIALQLAVEEKDRLLHEKNAADLQLRQAQKMEAVGQLTGGVAHDLNNILTIIIGANAILAEGVADRPELVAIAEMIDDGAARGSDLIRRMLAFARKQPLQPRAVDVNALVMEAAKLLRSTLGEHIEISKKLAGDTSHALIDPSQLTNAILNLALNARDAMPNGGRLVIETSNIVVGDGCADTYGDIGVGTDVTAGNYVMIAVTDSGHGIPASILGKVFEPFFTTKDVDKGTGLGLSMVYGFVKQSHGHIKIESEEGRGTTIRLYVPQAEGVAALAESGGTLPLEGGHETILVVEDDLLLRTLVAGQVRSLGYATLTAANAAEALIAIDGPAEIDLLLTDMIMPGGMNGRELAEEALRRRASLKILYTSGYSDTAIIHDGHLDPGVLLLAKPYQKSDLARMIRAALAA
jgi:signal transduction histidine kinase